ncbi:MAG: LPS O-antigen length regulator [SAR86 cluster bacterium]|uniref:LPS O-antigen length regulator n=1 Tax=SAR86 cluster bacterium TaxID=2030880 RepID=A0A2A5AH81_9GAMM|nr:MAG: LPS O-antigen length regulator [SAR86 cluster bacterium]
MSDNSSLPSRAIYSNDDEIDLRELFSILWSERLLIVLVTALFAIGSVIFALSQTDIFQAEAVLVPAEEREDGRGIASQFGGAAALLGVNIGSSGGNNVSTAIAVMTSRDFIGRFIDEHGLLVPLFAGKWDAIDKRSIIDDQIYDQENNQWLLENGEPTRLQAYRKFREVLAVLQPDRDSGLVFVSINWHDPSLASNWVNQLVADTNNYIKLSAVEEATNAIAYLRSQLETTPLVEMQRVFFQLIESQIRITMLADVRDEYVFRVIDPAVVPDQITAPNRAMICVIGTLIGGLVALLLVFIRRAFRDSSLSNDRRWSFKTSLAKP